MLQVIASLRFPYCLYLIGTIDKKLSILTLVILTSFSSKCSISCFTMHKPRSLNITDLPSMHLLRRVKIYGVSSFIKKKKNYSPNDLIGQYESEYNDFIYNSIKTFPDFWIKSKNIYIEVKSVFTFFNMYKTYGKIEENALQYNRKKAELANQNGYITRWVICDKSINGNWRFLLLPQSWWTLPLDSLIQLVAAKNFIYLKNIRV